IAERLFDQRRIMRGERVDDPHPFDRLAILKIFADQEANAGASDGGPQQSVPKSYPVRFDGAHRLVEIGDRARLDRHDGSPAMEEGRRSTRFDPGFPRHHAEELAYGTQRLETVSAPNRS